MTLIACSYFPKNPQLQKYDESKGYRFDKLELGNKNTDSLFVILTFSGGGTRAAALSYGVLEELNQTKIVWEGEEKTLLDEVDIISAVSGGSFTAAYYGLHRKDIFNSIYERDFLKKDIETALELRLLSPINMIKLAGGGYGRSDIAAEYYNKYIFHGAKYARLETQKQRPFVILNATDMIRGTQFPFIQDQFDLICSNLSELEIARAVASSSAFPGLLTPLTFQNYAGKCDYEPPRWVQIAKEDRPGVNPERAKRLADRTSYYYTLDGQPATPNEQPARTYIHLMDGGVSDNIGLRGILGAMNSIDPSYSIIRMIDQIKKLVIIVVNAAVAPESEYDTTPYVPFFTTVLNYAVGVPLDNYSFETLELLRHTLKKNQSDQRIYDNCNKRLLKFCPEAQIPKDERPYHYDFYVAQVAFDFIPNEDERQYFKKEIPTSFSLDSEQVDKLKDVGGELLREAPDFKKLLNTLK